MHVTALVIVKPENSPLQMKERSTINHLKITSQEEFKNTSEFAILFASLPQITAHEVHWSHGLKSLNQFPLLCEHRHYLRLQK